MIFKDTRQMNYPQQVAVLIRMADELVSVGEINTLGGVCDCCPWNSLYTVDECEVVSVVDLRTGEVLYREGAQ